MEIHNIVKQKIDSINSLPPNYEPNLESKWELLEASLKPNKKKPFIFWFNRIGAVAAVLLFFGGIGLFSIKVMKTTDVKKPVSVQVNPLKKEKNNTETDNLVRVKKMLNKSIIPNKNVTAKQNNLNTISGQAPFLILEKKKVDNTNFPLAIAENRILETHKKQKRFTEIDFGKPIINEPTEIEVASIQHFKLKFKIGATLPDKNFVGTVNDNLSFGFSKQIN
jgi:hypothetical protein